MAKPNNAVVSVRIPPMMLEYIDSAVSSGEYRNRGDFIACAIREYIRQETAKGRIWKDDPDA